MYGYIKNEAGEDFPGEGLHGSGETVASSSGSKKRHKNSDSVREAPPAKAARYSETTQKQDAAFGKTTITALSCFQNQGFEMKCVFCRQMMDGVR